MPSDPLMFKKIASAKQLLTPKEMCTGPAKHLFSFVRAVFQIEFEEKPNYQHLAFLLIKSLLRINQAPDMLFDWSTSKFRLSEIIVNDVEEEVPLVPDEYVG